jgi:hypothetical protein
MEFGYLTANIYTHSREDSLMKAAADMANVFKNKMDSNQVKKAVGGVNGAGIWPFHLPLTGRPQSGTMRSSRARGTPPQIGPPQIRPP